MKKQFIFSVSLLVLATFVISHARTAYEVPKNTGTITKSTAFPADQAADHSVGKLQLTVSNIGTFGDGFIGGTDPFTGRAVVGGIYPKGSDAKYVFAGAFWIGAVVGRDTLVSTGADGWTPAASELHPDVIGKGELIRRSQIDPSSDEFEGAISEEDIIAVYTDTLTDGVDLDMVENRPHKPLNIKVNESSYAWSYSYAEDFVLFDYKITNIGFERLKEVYMGIYQDADVGGAADCSQTLCYTDDICGFLHTIPETLLTSTGDECVYLDTVNIAWIADNDGDFDKNVAAPDVTATRIVRTPSDKLEVSFNWWISNGDSSQDFGPRERSGKGAWDEEFRRFNHGGLGTPGGDRNKYYVMKNREFDYDQTYTANVRVDDTLWLYPNQQLAQNFSDGFDTRYLLSFGPFEIDPGETLPISFAYVAGEGFHTSLDNFKDNLEDGYNPSEFNANLGFKDLATNARWASWIYDNPGVDTDNDGYLGETIICCNDIEIDNVTVTICDTNYITGDRVPDFAGAKPPAAPKFWISADNGKLSIRFNGFLSETTPDEFLARSTNNKVKFDFEGYRIHIARDKRAASYSVVASYDVEDYNKFIWTRPAGGGSPDWRLIDVPYSFDSLVTIYDDPDSDERFDPRNYPMHNPFAHQDSLFYFAAQDFNASEFGVDTKITKRFPNEPYPLSLEEEVPDPNELTDDGYFKYFEYQVEIENLLPTVEYWVSVTAFDFGSPKSGLPSLESAVTLGAQNAYAQFNPNQVASETSPKVYVYPNPYRLDGAYLDEGYEGRKEGQSSLPIDRVRAINFVNVPSNSIIRIYSLDGDLVREIAHDSDPTDPTANHAEWNMITRNTQLTVSGLYYWTVENVDTGEVQIGKLVIIM